METVPVWVLSISVALVGALALLLWMGSDSRHDKSEARHERNEEKLDDHETRITRLEESDSNSKKEIQTLRDRWHDMVDHCTQSISQWANRMIEMFGGPKK